MVGYARQKAFSMNMILNLILLITGVAAAITLGAPAIPTILMITLIGIPLAIALMAAPTLFLAAALTKLFYSFGRRLPGAALVAPVLAIGVLAAIPIPFNAGLEKRALSYVAADHDDLRRPFVAKSLLFGANPEARPPPNRHATASASAPC